MTVDARLSPVLDRLAPWLALSFDGKWQPGPLPGTLTPLLPEAETELDRLLYPISRARFRALMMQVQRHFPKRKDAPGSVYGDYEAVLGVYPEDILEQAVWQVIKTYRYHTLPKIADFVAIADPLLMERRALKNRIIRLRESQVLTPPSTGAATKPNLDFGIIYAVIREAAATLKQMPGERSLANPHASN